MYHIQRHRKVWANYVKPLDAEKKQPRLMEILREKCKGPKGFWYTPYGQALDSGHVFYRDEEDFNLMGVIAECLAEADIEANLTDTLIYEVIDPEDMI